MLPSKEHKYLIIGIGNEFRGDDAVGISVVNEVRSSLSNDADFIVEQHDLTRILDQWTDRHVVLIDAFYSEYLSSGTIQMVHSIDQLSLLGEKVYSSHSIGLKEVYELGKELGKIPTSLKIIGVYGNSWQTGSPVSFEVKQAVPKVAELVKTLVNSAAVQA